MSQPLSFGTADMVAVRNRLDRAVGRSCPSWLASSHDDLVQQAAMRVMSQLERDPTRRLNASYLSRVAYSVIVDEIRRRKADRVQAVEAEHVERAPDDRSVTAEESARMKQLGIAVDACLSQMVESRRRAVALYLQGHTVPQAASVLGWKPKKAENMVYRGLADLRRCLESKGVRP